MTGFTGAGLARIGTGRMGSLRGVVYSRNVHMEQGWVTYANDRLIFRTANADTKNTGPFCQRLNKDTLKVGSNYQI